MSKKGRKLRTYTKEFKERAVQMHEHEGMGYKAIAKALGMPDRRPIQYWVKKYRNGETLSDQRGRTTKAKSPVSGRPRTRFQSIEEERDYLKAQVEYLKKRYPNLHKGDGFKE